MAKNPTIGPGMKNLLGPKNVPTVGPLPKKDTSYKGFNIKRDRGGKGFSMVIQKKIKGFEETDMAGERIDELSKQTLKRYVKGATRDIGKRAYSAGLKGGADKPEAKQDVQRAEKHEKYIPKAVHRVQGKYYPKYVREKNPTYGGSRKYGGGSDYKSYKETHGEKGEPKARYTRKEEYEMNEDVEQNEQEQEEGEQEVMQPNVSDLVLNAIEQKPLDFQQSFADLMQQRIEDAVAERKLEVAAAFTGDDRSQYETGEDEPEEGEEEEEEAEEEPEAEEESDEEEEDEISSRNIAAR